MPIHDWTRVDAGLWHAFHQGWVVAMCDALNLGTLPPNYYALVERRTTSPRSADLISRLAVGEAEIYTAKADRIAIRRQHGGVVAVIEVVSPAHKAGILELRYFVTQLTHLISQNVHLLVIDLFPPGPFDPQGIHGAIWDGFQEDIFELPKYRPLTLVAYNAGSQLTAYVELFALGDALPDMPLFLDTDLYVPMPLEATYQKEWKAFPAVLKSLLEDPPKA